MPYANLVRDRLESKLAEWGYKIDINQDVISAYPNSFATQIYNYGSQMASWANASSIDYNGTQSMTWVEPQNRWDQNSPMVNHTEHYDYIRPDNAD